MGYSMVTPRYHYIEWRFWNHTRGIAGDVAAIEIYDRKADPEENTNIANLAENRQIVEQLSGQLKRGWRFSLPPRSAAISEE